MSSKDFVRFGEKKSTEVWPLKSGKPTLLVSLQYLSLVLENTRVYKTVMTQPR